jgi:hypothetical protein
MLRTGCHRLVSEVPTQPARPGHDALALIEGNREGMTFLWNLLAVLYVACWVFVGLATFRTGHYWLFWIGFIFPILWIIEVFIAPTEHAAARAVGAA